jgi:heavy metal translocating P-type ATPase
MLLRGSLLEDKTKDVLRLTSVGLVILVNLLGLWHSPFPLDPLAAFIIVVAGLPIFKEAYFAVTSKSITMEVAMTIGIAASLAVGEVLASMIIVFFTLASEFIEELTVDRSRRAIEDLIALAPRTARVKQDGEVVEVAIEAIAKGDVVVIRPGERIPVDGPVVDGAAVVNQAPITGESVPVEKGVGNEVFAGTVIQRGFLEVEAVTVGEDTTLGRIIKLVEEAEASKAPVQRFADRFASRFVPLVLILAALVAVVSQSVESAVSVIVVACPCAVAIATPLAVVASVGKAAKGGIIIKGGIYLEELSRVTTVVFDKTGTLTVGVPQVTDVKGFDDHDDRDIITFAAIAELHSEHHLADAVARKALEYDATVPPHQSCQIVAGKGVICEYADTTILMGNRDLVTDNDLEVPQAVEAYMREREDEGKTTMIVAHDSHVCGVISVADVVRRETVEGLKALRRLGIQDFVMMTGDTTRAAKAIAQQVGVDKVMAEMLPQDKVEAVRDLVQQGKTVLMVGDGVNDAPAIAEASVGAAMGVAGSDVAIETADVVLMTDDFRNIAQAIWIGKRAVTNIKENIGASVLFNVLGISLASIGVLSPIMAAAVHALPDVILFLNASRLLK